MRSPTDDGVDRPDLDAPQGVKATGTNRPKQTHTLPFVSVSTTKHDNEFTVARVHYTVSDTTPATKVCPVCLSVAYSSRETPGPIPNPEAKPANADGTATGRLWESKKPPTPNNKQTTQYNQERPLKHNRFNGLFLRFRTSPKSTDLKVQTPSVLSTTTYTTKSNHLGGIKRWMRHA